MAKKRTKTAERIPSFRPAYDRKDKALSQIRRLVAEHNQAASELRDKLNDILAAGGCSEEFEQVSRIAPHHGAGPRPYTSGLIAIKDVS